MSSTWGSQIKLSIFGESHGAGIGVVLDGLPAGVSIDMEQIMVQMARRAPGNDPTATSRREADTPHVLSGLLRGKTTGSPLAAMIGNTDTRSQDYENIVMQMRPGHADYTGFLRYSGYNDVRGGGHFSGRLTAPLVFAGAVCRQIIRGRGVVVGGHISAIAGVEDDPFDPVKVTAAQLDELSARPFSLVNPEREGPMRQRVEQARMEQDSVGGIVECAVVGLPAGLGSPMFGGVENVLSSLLFGIPAVKGVEFGAGFQTASLRGSQNNDPFALNEAGEVITVTNHHGGALGGISTGMPVIVRVALKPTPSISRPQRTVDIMAGREETLIIRGRHDPCIVPRALPVVEAAVSIGILELMEQKPYYSAEP